MATGWPMKTTYADGDVYSASDVNDITGTINLLGSSVAYAAGKNKIINGDFGVWQRGTSFTVTTTKTYTADRWTSEFGGTGATRTVSRQTFTPGTAPVAGYEGQFYLSYNRSVAGTSPGDYLTYRVEDVRTFAGQTATISFWAKANASMSLSDITFYQEFGSGGSGTTTTTTSAKTITTSWARYTTTVSVPSISGKTIGTSSDLAIYFVLPSSGTFTFDIWGVQLESGSTATAFQTATGTIQGELAACQRYFERYSADAAANAAAPFAFGMASSTTVVVAQLRPYTTKRGNPTITFSGNADFRTYDQVGVQTTTAMATAGSSTIDVQGQGIVSITATVASGLTQYRPYFIIPVGPSGNRYIDISAEL
jgi:hypothetical protein